MYTIGQFSRICRITTKALRHYEKMGIISPARVEPGSQYRYYTQEQVPIVQNVLYLKELGIPLKDVKRILDQNPGLEELRGFLEEHRRLLVEQMNLCSSRLVKLSWWEKALEARDMTQTKRYDVQIKELPEVQVRSQRRVTSKIQQELPPMLRRLLEEIEAQGGVCGGPPITLYYNEEFDPQRIDVEAAWPVVDHSLANRVLPAVKAAAVMHVGSYEQLEAAYQAVFAWINQNGYRALFPIREVYYNDPQVTPPEQLVTEIVVPVEKAQG